jgi:hypothetical protein
MAQTPLQTNDAGQALGKIDPAPAALSKPTTPPPRPTDADLEAIVAKASRGGEVRDLDPLEWAFKVQAAMMELDRRKVTGEYGKPWVPPVPVAVKAPEPQVEREHPPTPDPTPEMTEAEHQRKYYEWLRDQWVAEHPERQAAYASKLNTTRPITSRIATDALKFNSDPTVFLTTARTAIDAADGAKQALEAVEQGLRDKFDAAAKAMGFPGA